MIKILIADDHPLIAEGIKKTIELNQKLQVVKVLANGKEVLDYLKDHQVDLIFLDIDMPILNGIDCAEEILLKNSNQKIVMISMHQDPFIIKKVMKIGVKSYLLKTIPQEELLFAIDKILVGEHYFNADVTKSLIENKSSSSFINSNTTSPLVNDLTKREKEIIALLCKGFSNNEVAEKLFISPKTVDVHRTNIMRKLDIHNVVSLVRFALKNGLS